MTIACLRGRVGIGVLVAAVFALAAPGVAMAQTSVTPTRFDDPPATAGCTTASCSLRQAAQLAPAGGVTINLLPGTYELTQGQPVFLRSVKTINGAGARATAIDGNGLSRVVHVVEGAQATINDVTITGGNASAGQQTAQNEGGGINIEGAATLNLNRSAVVGNSALFEGGGIWNAGALVVTDSTIAGNLAPGSRTPGAGAGIFASAGGDVRLRNVTVSGNTASPGTNPSTGGGIHNAAKLDLAHVTIAGNAASTGSGLYQAASQVVPTLWNTIVTADSGTACAPNAPLIAGRPRPRRRRDVRLRHARRQVGRQPAARFAPEQRRFDRHARTRCRKPGDRRRRPSELHRDRPARHHPRRHLRHRRVRVRPGAATSARPQGRRCRRRRGSRRRWPASPSTRCPRAAP